MANQIVTLKDDNNNPTFPIAGGMAEDSITTQMLKDGSVTSDKIDSATIERTVYQRELIGTFVAPDSTKHDLYRIQYAFVENIPAGSYTTHNVALSDCYILSANFSLYRTDSAGVINISNDYESFQVVFTNNGDTIRFVNRLANAQTNATVIGTIECYKRAAQS